VAGCEPASHGDGAHHVHSLLCWLAVRRRSGKAKRRGPRAGQNEVQPRARSSGQGTCHGRRSASREEGKTGEEVEGMTLAQHSDGCSRSSR